MSKKILVSFILSAEKINDVKSVLNDIENDFGMLPVNIYEYTEDCEEMQQNDINDYLSNIFTVRQ